MLFLLALTFGLEADPIGALERTIGLAEATARALGREPDVQASLGVSDGETVWAVRYSTVGASRTLFASADVEAIRRLHPHRRLQVRDGDRLIVSEPLVELPGAWHELPEATAATVPRGGEVELRAFAPDSTAGEAAAVTPSG